MEMYLRGFILGISIAAPVGPIGLICIQRTLLQGRISGFASGIGAATADALYGFIAGFGLTFLSGFLVAQQLWLRLAGGLFLCYLGVHTLASRPSQEPHERDPKGLVGNYLTAFILTLTNPMTILSFIGIFAGMGLAQSQGDYSRAIVLVLGVFSGSALWWLILSLGVSRFKKLTSPKWMVRLNWIAGSVIFLFGILAFASLVFPDPVRP
jgi:threonine/homoserine/homoserine lactone efflux protein